MDTQGTQEPELTIDGLQKSLDELLQAADATELNKAYGGVSVETSGHVDERGKVGGGMAGGGDVGGLDDMMVAKMSEAGIPAGVISAFSAFMNGAGDEEEEDDEEEDDEEEDTGKARKSIDPEEGEPIEKSMDNYRQDPDVADAIDVSPFLEALTARTADQLDDIRKGSHVFQVSQNTVNRHMAAAVHQVGTLLKSQSAVINELAKRLNFVERAPAPARGATTLSGAQALAKSGEAGGERLTKGEIVSALSYMNLEKGIKEVNGHKTVELACLYEGGAAIDQNTVNAVSMFLRTHPTEAAAARSYS